jgi:hypothetical protein
MPILGIVASSQQSAFIATGAYESIATTTVGSGGSATVTFSSIPATFTHLQVRLIARSARSDGDNAAGGLYIQLNSSFLTAQHQLRGNGASVVSYANTGGLSNGAINIWVPATGAATGIFGTGIIDILDYANTNKQKTLRMFSGDDISGGGYISFASGLLASTSAVTSITFGSTDGAGNIPEYSQFALYGIKGA